MVQTGLIALQTLTRAIIQSNMKHNLTFPFESLSGTDSSGPKRTYYKHKGCQISRAYNPPKPPYNNSFNLGRTTNDTILKAYKLLTHEQMLKWVDFCNSWNNILGSGSDYYNVWTAFCTVNFYQLLGGYTLLTTPPKVYPPKTTDYCIISHVPGEVLSGIIFGECSNFPTDEAEFVFWITTPYSNFQHAYRKCESKLASGFGPDSVHHIFSTYDPFQFLINPMVYQIHTGDYLFVDTRLITEDGFPMPVRRFALQVVEGTNLISIGIVYHDFYPPSFSGASYNYPHDWTSDPTKISVFSDNINNYLRIPINFIEGTIIDAIRISFRAPTSGDTALGLQLDKIDKESTSPVWTPVKGIGLTYSGAPGIPYTYDYAFDPVTLESAYNYSVSARLLTANKQVEVFRLGFRTQKRIY